MRIHIRMKKGEGGERSRIGRSMGKSKDSSRLHIGMATIFFFSLFPIFQVLNLPPSLSCIHHWPFNILKRRRPGVKWKVKNIREQFWDDQSKCFMSGSERKKEREREKRLSLTPIPSHQVKKKKKKIPRDSLFSGVLVNYRVRRFGSFHPSKMKRGKKRRVVQTFFLFPRRRRLDLVLSVIQLRDRRLSSVCVRHYKPAKCWQFSLRRLAEKRWRRTQIPAVIQFRSTLYILCNNNNNDPRQLGDGEKKNSIDHFWRLHTHKASRQPLCSISQWILSQTGRRIIKRAP